MTEFETRIETPVLCKTTRIYDELMSGRLDLRVYAVFLAVCAYAWAKYRAVASITEIWCDRPGTNSVHEHWRGLDCVFRSLGPGEHAEIAGWTNARFPYGHPDHQTCKYHDAGSGYHLHLQARPL